MRKARETSAGFDFVRPGLLSSGRTANTAPGPSLASMESKVNNNAECTASMANL